MNTAVFAVRGKTRALEYTVVLYAVQWAFAKSAQRINPVLGTCVLDTVHVCEETT